MKIKFAAKLTAVICAAAAVALSSSVISAFAGWNVSSTTQVEAFTTSYQTYWKQKEMQKFPNGKFWNKNNDPDGYTGHGCQWGTSSGCGRVYGGLQFIVGTNNMLRPTNNDYDMMQCAGFARKLAQDFYGIHSSAGGAWLIGPGNAALRVGDQVRIGKHTVFITDIQSIKKVLFADCNAFGTCQIRWNMQAEVNQTNHTLLYYDEMGKHETVIDYIIRPGMAGDVNGDSIVTQEDLNAIRNIVNNTYPYSYVNQDYANNAADLDNDGWITMKDWNIANAQLNTPILTNQRFLTHCTITNYSTTHCVYYTPTY